MALLSMTHSLPLHVLPSWGRGGGGWCTEKSQFTHTRCPALNTEDSTMSLHLQIVSHLSEAFSRAQYPLQPSPGPGRWMDSKHQLRLIHKMYKRHGVCKLNQPEHQREDPIQKRTLKVVPERSRARGNAEFVSGRCLVKDAFS